jgi:hypothetical protein
MSNLDQFLATPLGSRRLSLSPPAESESQPDRLLMYSRFEADRRSKTARPEASPLVRWMREQAAPLEEGATGQRISPASLGG